MEFSRVTRWFFEQVPLRRPRTVLLLVLAVTAFFGWQGRRLELDASSDTLVAEGDEDFEYWRRINEQYEKYDLLIVTYDPDGELFSQEALGRLRQLKAELAGLERVGSVRSILDVPLVETAGSLEKLRSGAATLESGAVDIERARRELVDSPLYSELLIGADGETTALLIFMEMDEKYQRLLDERAGLWEAQEQGQLSQQQQAELARIEEQIDERADDLRDVRQADIGRIRAIIADYEDEAELFLGGVSMIANDMIRFIRNDLRTFGTAIAILMAVTLAVVFRRRRWVLLPMVCCGASVTIMVGILASFGWEVTVVSSNFISLQIIMTMALVLHLIVRYRQLSAEDGMDNRQLVLETVCSKIRPSVYAVLTTMAGFGSLLLSDLLPVTTFAWMMMSGLAVSLVVTFLVFPAALILLPKEEIGEVKGHLPVTAVFAGFTEKHGRAIFASTVTLTAVAVWGISKLQVENAFINYFKKDTEIYQGMRVIDQQLGGTTPLDVLVDFEAGVQGQEADEGDFEDDVFAEFEEYEQGEDEAKYWFTEEKISRIKAIHNYLQSLPQTGKVLSLANIIEVAQRMKGSSLDSLDLALLYSETPEQFKEILISPYVSLEQGQVRFWVRIIDSQPGLRRGQLLERIRGDLVDRPKLEAGQVHLTGMLVLYHNMLASLFSSQIKTIAVTMAILTGMFVLLQRSVKVAVLAMVPNIVPVVLVLGLMGWLGIPLDMMTITIAAISVGIAVDDTIHYIHRFRTELPRRGGDYVQTMHYCHRTIGRAMWYTTVTITFGFGILVLSNFVPNVYFGLLIGLAMVIALAADLTILPGLLLWLKPFGKGGGK